MARRFLVLLFCLLASPCRAAALGGEHAPLAVPAIGFTDQNGKPVSLGDFKGKVVVLDYWATWCAPCRAEFPALDRLQERLGAEGLEVVAVSVDRGGRPLVDQFYGELKIAHLAEYLDPKSESVRPLGLRGVPTALILDREGREVGRFEGVAAWDGPEMGAMFSRLLKGG